METLTAIRKGELRQEVKIAGYERKKPKRRPLDPLLPRIEIPHDILESQKTCDCGCTLKKIGEDVLERLDKIPAVYRVEKHVCPKYACPKCRGRDADGAAVVQKPAEFLLPKSNISDGFLADIATAKFVDHLPLNRQEKIIVRAGVDFTRSTLSGQLMLAAGILEEKLGPLLRSELFKSNLLHIDETSLKVLRFTDVQSVKQTYMWLFKSTGDRPLLWYEYRPGRSGDFLSDFLASYAGDILTDAYSAYESFAAQKSIRHFLCNAHARRNFFEATKRLHEHIEAETALRFYKALYAIERQLKTGHAEARRMLYARQKFSKEVFALFHSWFIRERAAVLPGTKIHEAIDYALNHWEGLTRYLEHPHAAIDNNSAASSIRPFVIGRKNWMFAGSPRGAKASALFYSLVESAKANRLEPYWYLRHLFTNLPSAKTDAEILALLPHRVAPPQA